MYNCSNNSSVQLGILTMLCSDINETPEGNPAPSVHGVALPTHTPPKKRASPLLEPDVYVYDMALLLYCMMVCICSQRIPVCIHLPHELRAHVLKLVAELDAFRHGYSVLRNPRNAVRLVQDCAATLRPHGHLGHVWAGVRSREGGGAHFHTH